MKLKRFWIAVGILIALGCGEDKSTTIPDIDKGSEEGKLISRLVKEVTPFIEVTNWQVFFREEDAIKANLSQEAINFAKESVSLINQIVDNKEIQTKKASGFLSSLHPWRGWDRWFRQIADICNHDRIQNGPFENQRQTEQRLREEGHHHTDRYASYGNQNDWTMQINYHGTPITTGHATYRDGAYRYHALVSADGNFYSVQGNPTPEPNPEFLSYVWPSWWWVLYVRWWHQTYC